MISSRLLLLTLLTSTTMMSFAHAETQTPPAEKPVTNSPVTNSQGGVVYSPLLPAKIHPRQTTADGLSIAAANVEQEDTGAIDAESIGLIDTPAAGALPATMWDGLSRANLSSQILDTNLQSSSPTLNNLIRRALISKPDLSNLTSDPAPIDTAPVAAASIFETRLKKLIAMGYYRDAFQLYRKVSDHGAANAATAKLGVESMIGSAQLGTACLENRVIKVDKKLAADQIFWTELNQFCDALLSPASAQDKNEFDALGRAARAYAELNVLKTIGSVEQLNALSPIQLLALHRSGRIGKGVLTEQTFATMPANILAALYAITPPRTDDAYNMLAHLIRRGLKSSDDMMTAFKNHTQALRKQSQAQGRDLKKGTKAKESAWTNLAFIYTDLMSADQSAPPATLLKNAITTASSLPNSALLPFAKPLAELEGTAGFTAPEAKKALWAMLAANISTPISWVKTAYPDASITESASANTQNGDDLLLKILLKDEPTAPSTISSTGNSNPANATENSPLPLAQPAGIPVKSNISLERDMMAAYLTGEPNLVKSAKLAYDNVFSLTQDSNYVMHSETLRNELAQNVSKGQVGQVVLKSVNIAENKPVALWSPMTFSTILNGLYSVGLGEDVKSLIRERMIGKLL